jgi:hypothetical protein
VRGRPGHKNGDLPYEVKRTIGSEIQLAISPFDNQRIPVTKRMNTPHLVRSVFITSEVTEHEPSMRFITEINPRTNASRIQGTTIAYERHIQYQEHVLLFNLLAPEFYI